MTTLRSMVLAASLFLAPLVVVAQGALPAAGASADAAAPVMAVWVEKTIHFTYAANTAYYSCDGLRNKVRSILKDMGARPDYKVTARACMNPRHGAEWAPMLDIVAAMPQAATPEVLAQVAKDASTRDLVAKVGGSAGPASEATAAFPARTRRVEFRDSPTGLLQPGDCELIEQLRDAVFVPLGAKVVVNRMDCVPHTLNNGIIRLSIDVLEPVPAT